MKTQLIILIILLSLPNMALTQENVPQNKSLFDKTIEMLSGTGVQNQKNDSCHKTIFTIRAHFLSSSAV